MIRRFEDGATWELRYIIERRLRGGPSVGQWCPEAVAVDRETYRRRLEPLLADPASDLRSWVGHIEGSGRWIRRRMIFERPGNAPYRAPLHRAPAPIRMRPSLGGPFSWRGRTRP